MSIQDHSVCPGGRRFSRRNCVKLSLLTWVATCFLLVQSDAMAQDGIQVHGDWEVTVTNPDGSIAQRRLFANALTAEGGDLLADLMAGTVYIPIRDSDNQPATNISLFGDNIVNSTTCNNIVHSGLGPLTASPRNASVDRSVQSEVTLSRTLVLGSDCIGNEYDDYSITSVQTSFASKKTENGEVDQFIAFSSKILDSAITGILPDQSVLLKVRYTFE